MLRLVVSLLCCVFVYAKHEQYDGFSVFEVTVENDLQTRFLGVLEDQLSLDVWATAVPSRPGKILVPKDSKEEFIVKLKAADIKYNEEVENIKEYLDLEDKLLSASSSRAANISRSGLSLDRIYTWEEIDAYIDLLGETYPNLVTVAYGGSSIEGRTIKYLRISTTNFQDTSKPIVYIQSLLHAREWVTQAVSLYAIQKLLIDVTEQDLIQDIDWIIVPVANPDGYVHTHESSRFWRKNRNTGNGALCAGVDLNRNFDVFWATASSANTCSDTYHGSAPFSEPETAIIRNIIAENPGRIELFLDIHSFGSWILFGYGNGQFPPNALILNLVGVQMAQAIDTVKWDFNPNYVVGNVALILYDASGSASDYATSIGVPLSYTFELPGFRFGSGTVLGFLVDPDFIEQAGYETWEGIKVGARYARQSYRARRGL